MSGTRIGIQKYTGLMLTISIPHLDDNDQIAPAGFGFECVGRQIANDAHDDYQHCGNVGNE